MTTAKKTATKATKAAAQPKAAKAASPKTKAAKAAPATNNVVRVSFVQNRRTTPVLKPTTVDKKWVLIDAKDLVLGRLAAYVAQKLRGKDKTSFTPNADCGDHVIIINADQVKMTRNKMMTKEYYYHTGYPGGIKTRTRAQMLSGKNPTQVVYLAVQRMMPRGPLGRKQMTQLHIYTGAEHPHTAQQPAAINFAAMNSKNTLR